jgi:hypothetical protein
MMDEQILVPVWAKCQFVHCDRLILTQRCFFNAKLSKKLLLFLSIILLISLNVTAQNTGQNQKDSLRNVIVQSEGQKKMDAYKRLADIYFIEAEDEQKRDTLFALYNEMDTEAERQGNNAQRVTIRIYRLQILNTAQQYNEVIKQTPGFLDFAEKKQEWNLYYQLYPDRKSVV